MKNASRISVNEWLRGGINPSKAAGAMTAAIHAERRSAIERERLEIMGLLGSGSQSVADVCRAVRITPSLTRQHLKRLKAMGLAVQTDGAWSVAKH